MNDTDSVTGNETSRFARWLAGSSLRIFATILVIVLFVTTIGFLIRQHDVDRVEHIASDNHVLLRRLAHDEHELAQVQHRIATDTHTRCVQRNEGRARTEKVLNDLANAANDTDFAALLRQLANSQMQESCPTVEELLGNH